jgi:hypothetical protein
MTYIRDAMRCDLLWTARSIAADGNGKKNVATGGVTRFFRNPITGDVCEDILSS